MKNKKIMGGVSNFYLGGLDPMGRWILLGEVDFAGGGWTPEGHYGNLNNDFACKFTPRFTPRLIRGHAVSQAWFF